MTPKLSFSVLYFSTSLCSYIGKRKFNPFFFFWHYITCHHDWHSGIQYIFAQFCMKNNKENKMKRDTFLPVVACNAYLDGMSKLSFFLLNHRSMMTIFLIVSSEAICHGRSSSHSSTPLSRSVGFDLDCVASKFQFHWMKLLKVTFSEF